MLKYLRIAVTALSLTGCVLLIALWVRSYYAPFKLIRLNTGQTTAIGILSDRSGLVFGRFEFAADTRIDLLNQDLRQLQIVLSDPRVAGARGWSERNHIQEAIDSLQQYRGQMVTQMMSQRRAVPHWLLLLVAATITATPWIKWRFSLRTLLIATTLIAVALGIIISTS